MFNFYLSLMFNFLSFFKFLFYYIFYFLIINTTANTAENSLLRTFRLSTGAIINVQNTRTQQAKN